MSLSEKQREALAAVAAGRVEWGNTYPDLERKRAAREGDRYSGAGAILDWHLDGVEVYGGGKRTFSTLAERGLIREQTEAVPTVRAPERVTRAASVSGQGTERVVPAHDRPADPGWRCPVVLTDAGREALG